jgi:hypothetical protein
MTRLKEYWDEIDRATWNAKILFEVNGWTWRAEKEPPDRLSIAATFSSLKWELIRDFGSQGDGETHFARTGRLRVDMDESGRISYAVEVGTEH